MKNRKMDNVRKINNYRKPLPVLLIEWGEAATTWYAGHSTLLCQPQMIMMRVGHLVE
jgi:hypothetical protein